MIFIKTVILIFIFFIATYLGFLKSNEYENRVKELKRFLIALNMFKAKIEFTYEPIKEIFESISKTVYEGNKNIFGLSAKNLNYRDVYLVWQENTEILRDTLEKEDIEIIKTFGKLLGKTDKNGQISEMLLSKELIERQVEKAEEEKNKNVKLYRSLGVITGLTIIIVFI